jgi:hypothetical protein
MTEAVTEAMTGAMTDCGMVPARRLRAAGATGLAPSVAAT